MRLNELFTPEEIQEMALASRPLKELKDSFEERYERLKPIYQVFDQLVARRPDYARDPIAYAQACVRAALDILDRVLEQQEKAAAAKAGQ
jgi:hypothetical protein